MGSNIVIFQSPMVFQMIQFVRVCSGDVLMLPSNFWGAECIEPLNIWKGIFVIRPNYFYQKAILLYRHYFRNQLGQISG